VATPQGGPLLDEALEALGRREYGRYPARVIVCAWCRVGDRVEGARVAVSVVELA
jgi:hypothetical protein